MADALAAGEQAVGELLRRQVHVARHVLEPFHAIARGALQLAAPRDGAPSDRRRAQRPDLRSQVDVPGEGDGIFHGELGARADGEVRRVRGIADQHGLAVVPALAHDAVEVQPRGAAQVGGVALQAVAVQVAPEQLLAESDRLLGVAPVQAVRRPGLLPGLDDHRRELLAELVGVDLEPAVLGPLEGKGEGSEGLGRAEPDEAAFAHVDVRLEDIRIAARVRLLTPSAAMMRSASAKSESSSHLVLEDLVHAQLAGALLQKIEQPLAADAAEAVAAAQQRRPPKWMAISSQ